MSNSPLAVSLSKTKVCLTIDVNVILLEEKEEEEERVSSPAYIHNTVPHVSECDHMVGY